MNTPESLFDLTPDLVDSLHELAQVPVLLIAADYDGTLAPIVKNPSEAVPSRESIIGIRELAGLISTHVAIISGRALTDLSRMTGLSGSVHLVGSHGSEFDVDFATSLSADTEALRQKIGTKLTSIANMGQGFLVEHKPASVALHYRNADPAVAEKALEEVMAGPCTWEGVYSKHGKKVIELSVVALNKGNALNKLRTECGASAVIYLGDDITDEDAFATLGGPDIGVKIGAGETMARYRLKDTADAARVLAYLSEARKEWLFNDEATPIASHSFLSDQRTGVVIDPSARVVWGCFPRLDSPALFAELLGSATAGFFSISDSGGAEPLGQEYGESDLIVETRWPTFRVTDYMDCSEGRPLRRPGRSEFVRMVEGSGQIKVVFSPRLDFGRVPTRLLVRDGGLEIEDTNDPIVLRSPGVEWTIKTEGKHHTAEATVSLGSEPAVFELRYGSGSLREGSPSLEERKNQTREFWNTWAGHLNLPSVEPEAVRRSALTLASLIFRPAGSLAAAATTSLPETVGGVRNWDYRFCWIRDAALSCSALVKLNNCNEAMRYLDWVLGVLDTCDSPERLAPLYSLSGQNPAPEAEIGSLSGYRGSRPVRIGNAASNQVQLDVFGPVVNLVAQLMERDLPLSGEHWRLVEAMVTAVDRRWQDPDHGIWEIRKPRRHHVHSKVMCWMTVDRAIRIAHTFMDQDRNDWRDLRDEIAHDVLQKGFKPEVGSFTAAYDGSDLDAAALHVGLSGLLAPGDPRFQSTVEAIERHLLKGPVVYRYVEDDGLPGKEGGFLYCTSWLISAYLLQGRKAEARALFSGMLKLAGPTGLLAEEFDPEGAIALGNFPQAYSHIGVIENAVALAKAQDLG